MVILFGNQGRICYFENQSKRTRLKIKSISMIPFKKRLMRVRASVQDRRLCLRRSPTLIIAKYRGVMFMLFWSDLVGARLNNKWGVWLPEEKLQIPLTRWHVTQPWRYSATVTCRQWSIYENHRQVIACRHTIGCKPSATRDTCPVVDSHQIRHSST